MHALHNFNYRETIILFCGSILLLRRTIVQYDKVVDCNPLTYRYYSYYNITLVRHPLGRPLHSLS